jgi:hypothetical protein
MFASANQLRVFIGSVFCDAFATARAGNVLTEALRGDYWDERVEMMQWWANYLDEAQRSTRRLERA